jgi:hypothetical protein
MSEAPIGELFAAATQTIFKTGFEPVCFGRKT